MFRIPQLFHNHPGIIFKPALSNVVGISTKANEPMLVVLNLQRIVNSAALRNFKPLSSLF